MGAFQGYLSNECFITGKFAEANNYVFPTETDVFKS